MDHKPPFIQPRLIGSSQAPRRERSAVRAASRSLLPVSAAGLLCAVVTAEASGFEGVILMKERSDGEVTTQKLYFKGDKVRVEESGPNADAGAVIIDGKTHEGIMIDPDEQAYFPFPWLQQSAEELKQEAEGLVVTKTGKRDKVAGHACEIYLERDTRDGSTSELCLAKGLGNPAVFGLTNGDSSLGSLLPGWVRDMVQEGSFPLRGIDRDKNGKEISRFEASKVEAKPLEDSLFLPPADYHRVNLEEVGRGQGPLGDMPARGGTGKPSPAR